MINNINETGYTILFVDDEPKTLKNFSKLMKSKYRVLTAGNSQEAKEILNNHSDEIAVIISDQRMPGGSGVELLAYVHQQYPSIVRLLTTAYSDLSDTIDAINEGEVFRYIVKPWDIHALQADIQSAMTFFALRKDRDILVKEKLSVLTQSTMIDRICRTVVLGHCQSGLRFIPQALQSFLMMLLKQQSLTNTSNSITDYWQSVIKETQHMACVAQHTSSLLKDVIRTSSFKDKIPVELWQDILQPLMSLDYCNQLEINDINDITGDKGKLKLLIQCIATLLENYQQPDTNADIQMINNAQLALTVNIKNIPMLIEEKSRILDISNDNSVDEQIFALWLTIFLLAYDHGGEFEVESSNTSTMQIKLLLPTDASTVVQAEIIPDWIEDIFVSYIN